MPESCQQKTPASGCPLDTPSLPFPSGRYSALSLLPAKGTIQPNIASQIRYMFQSTHPRGVRPIFFTKILSFVMFQSTHPRGVRQLRLPEVKTRFTFQSTHPRGVRQDKPGHVGTEESVSIHAPARGATGPLFVFNRRVSGFNPRTREGCDIFEPAAFYAIGKFQSTHPRGVRPCPISPASWVLMLFQSTHPRGVRLWSYDLQRTDYRCFNPRTREGCDFLKVEVWRTGKKRFNPRTREGCDAARSALARLRSVSIHAPARGATICFHSSTATRRRFNPRTREGCDPAKWSRSAENERFNPRTREGCDPLCLSGFSARLSVSIHAPARGATAPLPSPLNRAFERQNARTSAFWAFFHAVFLKQTVFSLFFSQLPLRGSHWETSVSLRFPFFRFCSFLLSRGAVFQNTSGPSGSMAVLAPTCSSRFFQLAPRK